MEHAIAFKIIPMSSWAIVQTNTENEFFFNLERKVSVWKVPREIEAILQKLVQGQLRPALPSSLNVSEEQKNKEEKEEKQVEKKIKLDLSVAEKEELFSLFKAKRLSAFDPWEKVSEFIPNSFKDRLNDKALQDLFAEYCQSAPSTAPVNSQSNKKVTEFNKLLEEQVNVRTEWGLFSKRFARDKRFMALTRPEREKLFREHQRRLRNSTKEESASSAALKEPERTDEGDLPKAIVAKVEENPSNLQSILENSSFESLKDLLSTHKQLESLPRKQIEKIFNEWQDQRFERETLPLFVSLVKQNGFDFKRNTFEEVFDAIGPSKLPRLPEGIKERRGGMYRAWSFYFDKQKDSDSFA